MIIDVHTHAFTDSFAPSAMAALEAEAGYPGCFDGTIDGLRSRMAEAGIDIAVVQPVATKPSQVRGINDWAARVSSTDVIVFGAIHPDLEDGPAEIERMSAMGLRGFKMHPEYQSFAPDEARLRPLYQAAEETGLTILFHAGADISLPTLRGTPQAFATVSETHPGLRMILAHMGGFNLWDEVLVHLAGRDLYLDTSYSLGHLDDTAFVELVRAHGAERVLFGTDAPWTTPAEEIARLRGLGLEPRELDMILGDNARALLHI